MTRLRSLIKEVLSQPKKKDCGCGCNDCGGKAPILTESKVKHLISEGLQYHMDKKISLFESVYRMGSKKHFELIREARALWVRGIIDVSEDDQAILETHLGNFGLYETVNFEGEEYDIVSKDGDWVYLRSIHDTQVGRKEIKVKEKDITINEAEVPLDMPMVNEESLDEVDRYSGFIRNPEDPDSVPFEPKGSVAQFKEDLRALFGKFKGDLKNPEFIKGVAEIMVNWKSLLRSQLDEAKKKSKSKKKDPPLNKPKRGGSKAYYVYVRDPKTKKIKKVSFGSGGLRAKIKNKKARNAFAARHNCKNKKDRTKAGYWSCNLPRYADQLGLGSKMNTFW